MTNLPVISDDHARASIEGIYKIFPTGLFNSPGIYFLLHRPSKRAYVGAVKSMSLHAAYLRGQFVRCAKGLVPTVRLANMPSFDTKWDDWVFKAFPVSLPSSLPPASAGYTPQANPLDTLVLGKGVLAEAQAGAFEFHGSLLRKVLADKGVLAVNTKSRVRGPNKGKLH